MLRGKNLASLKLYLVLKKTLANCEKFLKLAEQFSRPADIK